MYYIFDIYIYNRYIIHGMVLSLNLSLRPSRSTTVR